MTLRPRVSRAALIAALAAVATPSAAEACGACRGAGGAGGALTAGDERWTVGLSTIGRMEIGTWDSHGRAHGEPDGVHALDALVQLDAAVRVVRALELAASVGYGAAWLEAPGVARSDAGWSDVLLRARLDVLAEDAARPSRPGIAAWFVTRIPTARFGDTPTGGTAGLVGSFGLGAWEFALGTDVRRTFALRWQPFVAVEGALRLPDESLGFSRALGPRATARAGLNWFLTDAIALSLLGEWAIESNLALRGQAVPNSWQERTSVIAGVSVHTRAGFRFVGSLASDVLIDGLGHNAEGTLRLGLTVSYSAIEPAWRVCPIEPTSGASEARARSGVHRGC